MSNVDTVSIIHHSYTDVGYTHDQPIVWDLEYPSNGTLLRLPEALDPSQPVFTLHQKPAWEGSGIIVRLCNTSSSP